MSFSVTLRAAAGTGAVRWVAAALVLTAALFMVPQFGSYGLILTATEAAVYAIFALSFYFLLSQAGLLSFGSAAFFGAGSYGTAVLALKFGQPLWIAVLAGPA